VWKGNDLITSLAIDFTTKCNLSCDYCYLYSKQSAYKEEVSVEQLIETLKKTIDWFPNISMIELWGGESTYDPKRLQTFCEAMYKLGVITWIPSTNGTLLHKPENYNAWRFCNQYRASQFSFDGNPKYHNKHRNNSYDQVVNNLELVIKDRVPVSLRTTYSFEDFLDSIKENFVWFPKLYKTLFADSKLDQTIVDNTFCIRQYKNKKIMMLYQEIDTIFPIKETPQKLLTYRNYYKELKNLVLEYSEDEVIFLPPYINDTVNALLDTESIKTRNCASFIGQIYLHTPTGDIYPCLSQDVNSYQEIAKLGNVNSGELNWPVINTVRSFMVRRNKACNDCLIKTACFGGCYHTLPSEINSFNTYWNTNNITKCKFAHQIFDLVLETSQELINKIDIQND
jgi:radical SAM protein with 4Fe4S-binding SPASM domain